MVAVACCSRIVKHNSHCRTPATMAHPTTTTTTATIIVIIIIGSVMLLTLAVFRGDVSVGLRCLHLRLQVVAPLNSNRFNLNIQQIG